MDTYTEAHLFMAAIRILQYQKTMPPTLDDVCEMLAFSTESGHAVSRRLKKLGAIETLEDPFAIKLTVADHLAVEQIPRQEAEEDSLAKELERFQKEKRGKEKKLEDMQAELEKKKQNKISDIEAKIKEQMKKYKNDG